MNISQTATIRLGSAADPVVAIKQLVELIDSKKLARSLVIAQMADGEEISVIGHKTDPEEMAKLLLITARSLDQMLRTVTGTEPEPPRPSGTPTLLTIAAQWATLDASAIDGDVGAAERAILRKSFYAGAASLFEMMMQVVGPGAEPTQDQCEMMVSWHDELTRFGEELA